MEQTVRSRNGSSSKVSSQRKQAFLAVTAGFLVCFFTLLDRASIANHGNNISTLTSEQSNSSKSSNESSTAWRKFQEVISIANVSRYLPVRKSNLHVQFVQASNGSSSSQHNASPALKKTTRLAAKVWSGFDSSGKGARDDSLYHNFALFARDYAEMEEKFRIWVYPEAYGQGGEFSAIFLPHTHPRDRKIGNYYSEHKFKISLLDSKFVTEDSARAHLFFLPFSVNVLRNDVRVRQEASIVQFVGNYVENVSREFEFWNRSRGADHFFVCCHSVGRSVPQALPTLKFNAIQLVCSSNYYYKNYVPHKDVALPQVWPRMPVTKVNPPEQRKRLAFFAGRIQNSNVRQDLMNMWSGDPDLDFSGHGCNGSYEEHFQGSKFCVHVKGYEVNTARISDAIHFGCVPVIISDYYDLPFGDILDWTQFSVIVSHTRISDLKSLLQEVTEEKYALLHENVLKVRKHFQWNDTPQKYDAFHLSLYQLWLKRFVLRDSN